MFHFRKYFIFHPFLFAVYPLLFFYSRNEWLFSLQDLLAAAVIIFTTAGIILLFLSALTKDLNKSAVLDSSFFILFFSVGSVSGLLQIKAAYFVILYGLISILVLAFSYYILRKTLNRQRVTFAFAAISVLLIIFPLLDTGKYYYKISKAETRRNSAQSIEVSEGLTSYQPDIYYILLDGYAHFGTLKKHFEYDNTDFYEELKERGFYVVPESRSNYSYTLLSLSSSLNMEYILQDDGEPMEFMAPDASVPPVEDNLIQEFLRLEGYAFININSGFEMTAHNRFADANFVLDPSNFLPIKNALLWALLKEYSFVKLLMPEIPSYPFGEGHGVLYAFEKLKDSMHLFPEKPHFVFAHILSPHLEFTLDKDCNIIKNGTYLDKLMCTNKQVLETVDAILTKSQKPPIIVLWSDHGWNFTETNLKASTKDEESVETYQDRLRNFLAIYLPDQKKISIPSSLTPVNIFPFILNGYFGADLELLEDHSYYLVDEKNNPKIFDVTEEVKF